MKADITRDTHAPRKHYRRVLHQQGRVPLDADLNEGFAIAEHVATTTNLDVIGPTGTPKGDSFRLTTAPGGRDLLLGPGRTYVQGHLCELEATAVAIASFPSATQLELPALVLDGVPIAVGDWLEVISSTATAIVRVTALDSVNRRVTTDATAQIGGTGHRVRRRASYTRQPDLPAPEGSAGTPPVISGLPSGAYLAYLDVWQRHVTALDDPAIREVALGGPDTATRAKLVWQLKLHRVTNAGGTVDCEAALPKPAPSGALAARALVVPQQTNPCIVDPVARYRRLSNQLYRVEVHAGGTLGDGTCTFKFSRDNGSIVTRWLPPTGAPSSTQVVVEDPGPDDVLGFAENQWIELTDDTRELSGTPGTLVQIGAVEGNVLTINTPVDRADFPRNPRVRRWDHTGSAPALPVERPANDDGWLHLEEGVQVRFEPGAYATGDYWLIPARTISGSVEWPAETVSGSLNPRPIALPPAGIAHHLAALGVVDITGTGVSVRDDCRQLFPPLTHVCADDVCVAGDPCGHGWTTVQEALEDLCQERRGGCAITVYPGADWFERIASALQESDVINLCFAPGDFPIDQPIEIGDKRSVKITGSGRGSRLIAANEAALRFVRCLDVIVRDLDVSTAKVLVGRAQQPDAPRITGALTFTDCGAVEVAGVAARCADGSARSAACLAVNQTRASTAASPSVRISGCDLLPGDSQIGILVLNPSRVTVSDNRIGVASSQRRSFDAVLIDPQRRASLEKAVLSGMAFTTTPGAAEVRVGGRTVWIRSDLDKAVWAEAIARKPLTAVADERNVRSYLYDLARRMVASRGTIGGAFIPALDRYLVNVAASLDGAAAQGIVVAGRRAEDVRITGNSVRGVVQGIHVGTSHANPSRTGTPDRAGRVVIEGNVVDLVTRIDLARERHGIFVGNCESVSINDNRANVTRTGLGRARPIEGIRVYGFLGGMATVRQNHLTGFTIGVRFSALNNELDGPSSMWRVIENLCAKATKAVEVGTTQHVVVSGNKT